MMRFMDFIIPPNEEQSGLVQNKSVWSDIKESQKYPGEAQRMRLRGREYVILYSGNRWRTYRMGDGDTLFPDSRRGDQIGMPYYYMDDAKAAAEKDSRK